MTDLSRSPDRGTFQKENYLKRMAEEGRSPDNDEDVKAMVEFYEKWANMTMEKESDPDWEEHNMEYDLRASPMMLANVRNSNVYAQNLLLCQLVQFLIYFP